MVEAWFFSLTCQAHKACVKVCGGGSLDGVCCWVVPLRQERKPTGPCQPVLMQMWVLSLVSAVFKPCALLPWCRRQSLWLSFLSPGCGWVWVFLGVFKGHLPGRSSELIVSGGAVARCWQASYTHAGKSIFWGDGTTPAGIQLCWELGTLILDNPDPGTSVS